VNLLLDDFPDCFGRRYFTEIDVCRQ